MGFSTSRIILHRDSSGNLTPGSLAQEAEMLALGRAIAAGGGGVLEGAFDFASYDDVPYHRQERAKQRQHMEAEWKWMTDVAREWGVSLSFASGGEIFKRMGQFNEEQGKQLMNAQVLIRPQGILMSFDSSSNPFQFTPTWKKMAANGSFEWSSTEATARSLSTLRDPAVRDALVGDAERITSGADGERYAIIDNPSTGEADSVSAIRRFWI